MKQLRTLFVGLFACLATIAFAADTLAISGMVHDGDGKPLAGIAVTLSLAQSPASTQHTTSGPAGEYRFTGLTAGNYTLAASADGFVATTLPVRVSGPSKPAIVDLTLTSAPSAKPAQPALQFEASGLRGLIDPGGYSAPANAAAASSLLHGMADIKRNGNIIGGPSAMDWPCSLAPALQKELAANPNQADSNRKLGDFYLAHGDIGPAIPLLERGVQADSSDLRMSLDLAIAYIRNGQFDAARKLLSPIADRPNPPLTHQLLARADEGSGMFQEAAEQYGIADREQPSEANTLGIGYELVLAGALADALKIYQSGEQKYPKSIELHIGAGSAQFLAGHAADAVHSFLAAIQIDPADPRPYPFLAAASDVSTAEPEQVQKSFERYAKLNPDNAGANYLYAHLLFRQSAELNADRVDALLQRALQLDPGMAKAHLQLAELYDSRTDYDHALPEYEAAVRLAPELTDAHYRFALACKRAGRAEQAAHEMQLFQQAKARSSNADGDAVDITQFLSVIDTSAQHATADTQCP